MDKSVTARVSRVGIVAKSHLRAATPHLLDIERWLAARGIDAIFESATAGLMPAAANRKVAEKSALVTAVELVVVLGVSSDPLFSGFESSAPWL